MNFRRINFILFLQVWGVTRS